MSNPHLTDHDKVGPLGPPTKPEVKKPPAPVWHNVPSDHRYESRTLPDGSLEVKRKDGL